MINIVGIGPQKNLTFENKRQVKMHEGLVVVALLSHRLTANCCMYFIYINV